MTSVVLMAVASVSVTLADWQWSSFKQYDSVEKGRCVKTIIILKEIFAIPLCI